MGTVNTELASLVVLGQLGQVRLMAAASAGGAATCTGRTGWKGGHREGAAKSPAPTDTGCQGQLSCGEKLIVSVQLCCGASENVEPGGELHVSASLKLGTALKSPGGKLFAVGRS
jgi:hypothetical protein